MNFHHKSLSKADHIELFKSILKPRLIEEKMLVLLRQGKLSKWFSGIGQEAIAVGVTKAMHTDEYILPMHRNLGVFTERKLPLDRLFSQWQGKQNGFTKGRDRSFHFGTQEFKIIGMISHLGPQLGVADGVALAHKLKDEAAATAVFTGEGGTSEGDFHEALNVASVWQLPVLFCIENNGYGLSTPVEEQFKCEHIADKGVGYGMESLIIDGNNIVEVYTKVKDIAERVRQNPKPVLIEFKTFRRRGHEEASGTKYVPEDVMLKWEQLDPVDNYELFILESGFMSREEISVLKSDLQNDINTHLKIANEEQDIEANLEVELADVYKPHDFIPQPPTAPTKALRFVDAIAEALEQSMDKHKDLIIMGQDIADYGGVFKITDGLSAKYGKHRVRNTPICESAIVSAAMGLSIKGIKSVVEMQFGDFVSSGFNPIVNYLAKVHYRWGQQADVVIRMPCGAGVGAGPFHSQTNEAWFTKTPGLKVVYPSSPQDAKGLLAAAIEDPNPVMFFEHKALYRSIRGDVAEAYFTLELGKANVVEQGTDISVITYGAAVHWATDVLEKHPEISAELIDLRSLCPLDEDTIFESVRKTGKVLILQEDSLFGGLASDLSALISEHCFEYLDAPIKRVASLPTPIPFAKNLENQYLSQHKFEAELMSLYRY
jgi:2-oxoisovalerate dehydrogenase E1 component